MRREAERSVVALRCEEVARLLPAILDNGELAAEEVVAHVEGCLVCQAELARYRRLLRLLAQLRLERPAVPEGLFEEVLESIGVAAERQLIRSALSHRRLAYVSGIVASGAAASVIVLVARARRGAVGTRRHARQTEGA
jgi:predicted anti-sigma-YlaC factor YlaD